ncbi:MAG: glycine cleavage system protein H, partial [Acidimicrobiia bacterium]|nr:glycine cleavage system protein H [Acidimicrobiia bacterium]
MKMDYETPDHLLYTDSHEWIRRDPDNPNLITIGITDYAQDHVGDVVFLDYQVEDETVEAGDVCAEIESTKTVADLYT